MSEVPLSLSRAKKEYKFIDLFAGLGGTRIGFEQACKELKLESQCVFSSEIKNYAIDTYIKNFGQHHIYGDITQINPHNIPDHDFLLAGFPCQPFSAAGNRKGFLDHRGGLFFSVLAILQAKQPEGFLLENVEGLVNHDKGKTLQTIINALENLGYNVNHKVLDSSNFGVPQVRKRVYIVGNKKLKPSLTFNNTKTNYAKSFLEEVDFKPSQFSKKLLAKFSHQELWGKSIKDKRGGENNIHSWDLELKGSISDEQKQLLNTILKKRRYKKWAIAKGIDWMDGMPLTTAEIRTFYDIPQLQSMLDDLTTKGYLRYEYPKKIIEENGIKKRVYKEDAEKGYNIVVGKLSFPIAKIIDPEAFIPTIVATEVGKIAVASPKGVRPITIREALKMSGFPDSYTIELDYNKAFDLIGNTVMPPVIKEVALNTLKAGLE